MPSSVLSQLCLHKVCLLLLQAAELAEEELESGTGIKHGCVGFFFFKPSNLYSFICQLSIFFLQPQVAYFQFLIIF
jgi:hypothetical protein